jgi:hypothetical protein
MGCAVLTGVGYVRPDWVGVIIGLGLVGLIWVHRSGALAVLALITCGVMFLFPGPNPVQLLPAAVAFAALIAVHASRLLRPSSPPALRLFAGIIIAGALGHQAFQISERLMAPEPSPRDVPAQLQSRDQLLAEAALFKGLDVHLVFYSSELGPRMLGPLVGFRLIPYSRELEPYSMQVSDTLWLAMDSAPAESLLLDHSLLDAHHADGHPGELSLTLPPGYYAAGMALVDPDISASLSIRTSCEQEVLVDNLKSGTTWVVRPFRIHEGCTEVEVSIPERGAVDKFFLAPLPSPELSLRGAEFHAPLLGLSPIAAMPEKH